MSEQRTGAVCAAGRRPGDRGGGFTLVELLVVIAIISLLVTIMMPALSGVIESARRTKCAASLNGIGKALATYENTYTSYPYVPLHGAGWGVQVGGNRSVDPAGETATSRNPSSCLYLLVQERLCVAGMFVCPSAKELPVREAGRFWDFAGGTAVSYSLMNPYGAERYFNPGEGAAPILADAGPYFDPATGLRNNVGVVDLPNADEEAIRRGNSPNHLRAGQNVCLVGGSVKFEPRADVGVDLDNIYTRADESDGTDPRGSIPAPGSDGSAEDQGPAGWLDSYLVP